MAKFHLTSVLLIVKALSVFAASKEGSVRIFPNVEQNVRSISFPELDGIVSHFVGVESEDASFAAVNDKAIVNAASDIFNKPKANLLISVDGVDSGIYYCYCFIVKIILHYYYFIKYLYCANTKFIKNY